jgi:CubicO group peptidase (beta-lactamase class C family)
MTKFLSILSALLVLTSCASPSTEAPGSNGQATSVAYTPMREMKGPQATGVTPDAPKDMVGVILDWTAEQTIVNFKHFDQIFPVRTVPRGGPVLELPVGDLIDPVVPIGDRRLSIEQVMLEQHVTGVIALHHGRIVYERYANGRTAQDRWTSMSVTKSITSTLIGAAIRDGLIGSIDDPITRYLPELKATHAFDGVTLRHMITMSSGLRFNEIYADHTSDVVFTDGGDVIDGRPPIVSYAMKLVRQAVPGTVNEYQTINTDLLGIALSRALKGRTLSDYLSEKIWRRAGMEADAYWPLTKTGIERGGGFVSATLRDFARLGLFIARGDAGPAGEILPAGWMDQARAPVFPPTDSGSGYGWGWWVRADGAYEAMGAYGQSITIYPKDDVVIAINAASIDPSGFGLPRWRILQALDAAAAGRPDPNDTTR